MTKTKTTTTEVLDETGLEILKYYASDKFNPVLPSDFNFRHFRVKNHKGVWRKVPIKVQNKEDLQRYLVRLSALDVYYGTSTWLNPHKVAAKSGSGAGYIIADNLLLSNDLVFDIDAEEPITLKSLNNARKSANNIYEVMKCFNNRFKFDYAAFSITGEQPILTKRGLIPIKEAKAGDWVLSYDGCVKFSEVYNTINHEEEIYEINYQKSCAPMKVTGKHAVFKWDCGEIKCVAAQDIEEGDYLITFNGVENEEKVPEFDVEYKLRKNIRNEKIKINPEIMRLIGHYLSNGCCDGERLGFSWNVNEKYKNLNKKLLEKYVVNNYFEELRLKINSLRNQGFKAKDISENLKLPLSTIYGNFNAKPRNPNKISINKTSENCIQQTINSRLWSTFIVNQFGQGAKIKSLPSWVWFLPKEHKLELLRGIIDGDGLKTNKYNTRIKLANKQLILELVWLCRGMGISCRYHEDTSKDHPQPKDPTKIIKGSKGYCITVNRSEVYGIELKKFAPAPKEKLIPLGGIKVLCEKHRITDYYKNNLLKIIKSKNMSNRKNIGKIINWLNEKHSKKFDSEDIKLLNNYVKWCASDLGFLSVKSIKKKEKKEMVYDVCVKGAENFFAGKYPILLHNTGYKGFRLAYQDTNLKLPQDPRKRIEFVENERKAFIQELFKKWEESESNPQIYKIKPFFDEKITTNALCVVRVLGTAHSTTGYISTKIPVDQLRWKVEKILDNIPHVGSRRPVIPKREMKPTGDNNKSPRPRLDVLADDVSGLASLPPTPKEQEYYLTNKVLGVRKCFIPIFIYPNNQKRIKKELKKLQEKHKLGNMNIFEYEDNIIAISLKVMQKKNLQKVLNESTSKTKHDFRKHHRILAPFLMKQTDVMKHRFSGKLSRGHSHFINPQRPRKEEFYVGWEKIEFIKARFKK